MPFRHDGEHAEVDQTDRMISLQFDWGRERKEVSSIFIGTSPEFELALYTLCFVAGAEVTLMLPRTAQASVLPDGPGVNPCPSTI